MDRSVGALYTGCKELFDVLVDAASQQLTKAFPTSDKIQDEFDRFRIWGGNLGAGHSSIVKVSLDWRLRTATELKEELIQLLEEIASALEDLHEIVSGAREDHVTIVDADDEAGEIITVSEAAELFGIVSDSIAGLFRLSLIIQKATPRDRFLKALTNVKEPFDPLYDLQHVGAKFPKLDSKDNAWLRQKLATAITQRRQFFRYSRDHQERKANSATNLPVTKPLKINRSDQRRADVLSQLHPESLVQTQASTLILDRLDAARIIPDEVDDGLSQTSFATSVGESHDYNKLDVPRLDDVSKKQREFECPYCCAIIAPRNQKQWKKHVFEDLRPYICTSKECDTKLFRDRRTWFDHELSQHRCLYRCWHCQSQSLYSEKELHKHISKSHGEIAASTTLEKLLVVAKEAPRQFAAAECPFCDEWANHIRTTNPHISADDVAYITPQQFRDHLAAHMEQLALFALPKYRDDSSGDGSNSVVASSTHSTADIEARIDQGQSLEELYPLAHEDYTVALISNTARVEAFSIRMLDRQHPKLPVSSSDHNNYLFGQIGHHNVVMVTPQVNDYGSVLISTQILLRTFSKLRFAFLIDAGSGIIDKTKADPSHDIFLGDVVVYNQNLLSMQQPELPRPSRDRLLPMAVRSAFKNLSTQLEDQGRRIRLFLDPVIERYSYCSYPGIAYDVLLDSKSERYGHRPEYHENQARLVDAEVKGFYLHPIDAGCEINPPCDNCRMVRMDCIKAESVCERCTRDHTTCTFREVNRQDLIARTIRKNPSIPVVHYGRITGMNRLTTDPKWHDRLLQDFGVLCIGENPVDLPTGLPCLVVRGISDYGLNRPYFKGRDWRGYALAVATAYAFHILDWIQEPLDHREIDWLIQKDRISRLYQSGLSVSAIQDKMKTAYGFDATLYQYQCQIIAWKLTKLNTAEIRHLNRNLPVEDVLEENEFRDYEIDFSKMKCVCLNSEIGDMIQCDSCSTWQHLACYYEEEDVPTDNDSHYCVDCEPRSIAVTRPEIIQAGQHKLPDLDDFLDLDRLRENVNNPYKAEDAALDRFLNLDGLQENGNERHDKADHVTWKGPVPSVTLTDGEQPAIDDLRLQRKKDHENIMRKMERNLNLETGNDEEVLVRMMKEQFGDEVEPRMSYGTRRALPKLGYPSKKPKGILRPPTQKFSEDPAPFREGVAPSKNSGKKGIPPDARWTKISRKLVSPEALELAQERYEESEDTVIILRVLTKEEIEKFAIKTQELRARRDI